MTSDTLPLIILGGRDRGTTRLPEAGRDKHLLRGYKAVDLKIGGRSLIELLIERMRATGAFDPIFIAGPAAVYEPVVGDSARIVETDAGFGENIRAGLEAVQEEFPGRRVGVITCDVLPEPGELAQSLDDYRRHLPCDFWGAAVRIPENPAGLGASGWKPKYFLQPDDEDRPVPILASHLIVVDPKVLRLELIYGAFDTAYRTRNRGVAYRRTIIIRNGLWSVVKADLKRILALRWPTLTLSMVGNGMALGAKLKAGKLTQRELEDFLRVLWVRSDHRRRHPESRGRIMFLDGLSLAKDIDTEEEAREIARALEEDSGSQVGTSEPR